MTAPPPLALALPPMALALALAPPLLPPLALALALALAPPPLPPLALALALALALPPLPPLALAPPLAPAPPQPWAMMAAEAERTTSSMPRAHSAVLQQCGGRHLERAAPDALLRIR